MRNVRAASRCGGGELGQDLRAEPVEDDPVAKEPRDRDPAEGVEERPFLAVRVKVCAVREEIGQVQILRSSPDAPADLSAHAPKARPREREPRQRTLEEFDAKGFRHRRPRAGQPACCAGRARRLV
jgi:hypothetical protein